MADTWKVDENNNPIPIQSLPIIQDDFVEPLPVSYWKIKLDGLGVGLMPYLQDSYIDPLPYGLFRMNDGDKSIYHKLMPEMADYIGAFEGCSSLIRIKTPNSLQKLGKKAFKDAGIRKIKLPQNCTYYNTTFPEDCNVTGGQIIE